tara:strand:- start:1909 stop:2181 length:273 start_codon:yes stop_codon:yes gene_type:complete
LTPLTPKRDDDLYRLWGKTLNKLITELRMINNGREWDWMDIDSNFKCSICGENSEGWGHNPEPVKDLNDDGPCCDTCNYSEVIVARLMFI